MTQTCILHSHLGYCCCFGSCCMEFWWEELEPLNILLMEKVNVHRRRNQEEEGRCVQ